MAVGRGEVCRLSTASFYASELSSSLVLIVKPKRVHPKTRYIFGPETLFTLSDIYVDESFLFFSFRIRDSVPDRRIPRSRTC